MYSEEFVVTSSVQYTENANISYIYICTYTHVHIYACVYVCIYRSSKTATASASVLQETIRGALNRLADAGSSASSMSCICYGLLQRLASKLKAKLKAPSADLYVSMENGLFEARARTYPKHKPLNPKPLKSKTLNPKPPKP